MSKRKRKSQALGPSKRTKALPELPDEIWITIVRRVPSPDLANAIRSSKRGPLARVAAEVLAVRTNGLLMDVFDCINPLESRESQTSRKNSLVFQAHIDLLVQSMRGQKFLLARRWLGHLFASVFNLRGSRTASMSLEPDTLSMTMWGSPSDHGSLICLWNIREGNFRLVEGNFRLVNWRGSLTGFVAIQMALALQRLHIPMVYKIKDVGRARQKSQ